MKPTHFCTAAALAVLLGVASPSAQGRIRIGILPFDVASVDGGSASAAAALAKLVRAQMVTSRKVQPVLLEMPAGARLPLSDRQIAEIAEQADVAMIVAGTVLEASTERGSNRVSTGSFGGAIGTHVGGSVTRTRARIGMQAEIAGRDGQVRDSFEVEGDNTDVGVGTDLWTAIGSFDVGDSGWDKSPMGKALKEAAEELADEVIKRAGK
jgi:hypothetical protein